MAERLVRLYGPALISNNLASPTTLFTVPTGKTYLLRLMQAISPPSAGSSAAVSMLLGKTDLDLDNLIGGLGYGTSTSTYGTNAQALTTPVTAGEVIVAAYTSDAGNPASGDVEYIDTPGGSWTVASTADATSYASAAFIPQAFSDPTNMYFLVVNTKAATPDVVSSITDAHTDGFIGAASVASAGTSTIKTSIWSGYAPAVPTDSAAYTVNFGGTETSCRVYAIAIPDVASSPTSGSALGGVLQTATNTGTTATVQGVTMTPIQSDSIQLLVVGTEGVASSYTGPSNSTELADGTLATPTSTAAAYIISPSVSNPSATIGSAGSQYAVACVEIARGGLSNLTVSGLVIE